MKEQCMICGSIVEDVSGICPVCGGALGRSTQVNATNSGSGYGQSSNPGQPVYQNGGFGYGQPYNYQNPNQTMNPSVPQKKLFSILSIVLAGIGVLTMCFPVVSILFCLAAVVLGIIALVKKQIKAPAILGLIFGGLFLLIGFVCLVMNLMLQSVINTGFMGIIKQCYEALEEEPQALEDVGFTVVNADGSYGGYYYSLHSDGTYLETYVDANGYSGTIANGTFETYNFMDAEVQTLIQNEVIAAMGEGYEIKDLTCVILNPEEVVELEGTSIYNSSYYEKKVLVFIFPENYQTGDRFYLIQMENEYDYNLIPIDDLGPIE